MMKYVLDQLKQLFLRIHNYKEDTKLEVMNGRYGPYLTYDGKNYRLPKAMHDKAKALTYEECMKIIEKGK